MGELIDLEELNPGLTIRCRCGNTTWYLYTDEENGETTLITSAECAKCNTMVRVTTRPDQLNENRN